MSPTNNSNGGAGHRMATMAASSSSAAANKMAQLIACSTNLDDTLAFMGQVNPDAAEFRPRNPISSQVELTGFGLGSSETFLPTDLLMWEQHPFSLNGGLACSDGPYTGLDIDFVSTASIGSGEQQTTGAWMDIGWEWSGLAAADPCRLHEVNGDRPYSSSGATALINHGTNSYNGATVPINYGADRNSGGATTPVSHDSRPRRRFRRGNSLPSGLQLVGRVRGDSQEEAAAAAGGLAPLQPFCPFCQKKGAPEAVYNSHNLRSSSGEIVCLTLKRNQCPSCGELGHTPRYCPNPNPQAAWYGGALDSPRPFRNVGSVGDPPVRRQRRNSAGVAFLSGAAAAATSAVGGDYYSSSVGAAGAANSGDNMFFQPRYENHEVADFFAPLEFVNNNQPPLSSTNSIHFPQLGMSRHQQPGPVRRQIPLPMEGHRQNVERNRRNPDTS